MRSLFMFPLIALAAVGCASKTGAPVPPTTVSGSAALSTFPRGPTAVAATDEAGLTVSVPLGSDGSFSVSLPKGHTYKLALATATTAVPLVFPRQTGKLDLSFVLSTDGAAVRLGAVRYLAAAPTGGFKMLAATTATGSQGGSSGDCVDCVNDDQQTTCDSSGGGGSEGEGTSSSGDAKTPEPSSSGETDNAEQADPNQEMAVGDENAPDHVIGCEGGDGHGGDNVDQTSGH